MAVNPPPIQETIQSQGGTTPQAWIKWFSSIFNEVNSGFNGSFINGDGDTVTVVNGKITDVS